MTESTNRPLILVGPSGSGKTTIAHELVSGNPGSFRFSVSATTRRPRGKEVHGEDYLFVTRERFEEMIAEGALAEWAEVHGNLYGTPIENLDGRSGAAARVVLDIDVQGAKQVMERIAGAIVIFILPPSGDEWIRRLFDRATETDEELIERFQTALTELEAAHLFEEFVVNGRLEEAVEEIQGILAPPGRGGLSPLAAEGFCRELGERARAKIGELMSRSAD